MTTSDDESDDDCELLLPGLTVVASLVVLPVSSPTSLSSTVGMEANEGS
jgi:hypothetical protein